MKRIIYAGSIEAALVAVIAAAAQAATFTWDGGGTTTAWSDDLNWVGNVQPANNGTAGIVFGATNKDVTVVNQDWNINSLTFDDDAPGMEFLDDASTTLTIQANNMFGIGLTNLANEVHSIENKIILGGSQIWNNATGLMGFEGDINLIDHTLALFSNGDGVILAGQISGSPASGLSKNGDGELLVSGLKPNTYSGTTTVNAGTLTLGKGILALPAVPATLKIGDGIGGIEADKVVWQGNSQVEGDVLVNSSGLLDLNGHDQFIFNLTLAGGHVQTGAGKLTLPSAVVSEPSTLSSVIKIETFGTLNLGPSLETTVVDVADGAATDDLIINGEISAAPNHSLIKGGTGQLAFQGASPNTYTGSTFARGGTLLLDKSSPDGAIRGDLLIGTVGPDTSFVRLAQSNQIQAASGNVVAVGPVGILNTNGFSDAIGPLVMEGGRVTTGGGVLTVGFGVSSKASTQIAIISGNLDLNGSVQTFDIEGGNATVDLDVAANIFDGGVNKTGIGKLIFRGFNTYTGPTVVNAGTLLVNNSSGSGTGFGNIAVNASATLGGNGSIAGSVSVASFGALAPGDNIGDLNVGAVAFDSNARFSLELGGLNAGTQFDQLIVAGNALLNGSLRAVLVNSFVPAQGDTFKILTAAGNVSGTFPSLNLPSVASGTGLTWQVHYNSGDVTLEVLTALLGDYNGNGVVDAADYTVWRDTLGQIGTGLAADGNGNNQVDAGDYTIWKTHFGEAGGSGAGSRSSAARESSNTAVPEPSAMAVLLQGMLMQLLHRRANVSSTRASVKRAIFRPVYEPLPMSAINL